VIAVDTNILVYCEREESPFFRQAERCIIELAEGTAPWAIPWHCIHEFFSVVTNPRIWRVPTTPSQALEQIGYWMESPTIIVLTEGPSYWVELQDILMTSGVRGPKVHDARIAALCREHGVTTLWSADRDFSRFGGLKVVNPLVL
jgi:toxin-antitoxin system PIN domain toxin